MPIDPLTLSLMLTQIAGGAIDGATGNSSRKKQEQLTREQMAQDERQSKRQTALTESLQDPFRQQLDQMRAIGSLDRVANASYKPVQMKVPDRYASYVPEMSGGYSYEPPEQLRNDARALQSSVRAGRTAPSMTQEENYGKAAVLNLPGVESGALDPMSDDAFSYGAPERADLGFPSEPTLTAGSGAHADRPNVNLPQDRTRYAEMQRWQQANPDYVLDWKTGKVSRKGAA